MRLNDNAGAVVEDSGGGDLGIEEKVHIGFLSLRGGRGMHGTLNCVLTILFLDLFGDTLKFVARILSNDLKTNANIRHHMLGGLGRLTAVLLEETSGGCWGEATHLQLTDHESASVEVVDNFTSVDVGVGLNQQERGLLSLGEAATSECITVVN